MIEIFGCIYIIIESYFLSSIYCYQNSNSILRVERLVVSFRTKPRIATSKLITPFLFTYEIIDSVCEENIYNYSYDDD